jgi:hypothetical protein
MKIIVQGMFLLARSSRLWTVQEGWRRLKLVEDGWRFRQRAWVQKLHLSGRRKQLS